MMTEKKILIVSRSFYPINSPRSFRATELVKEFARQGHDVTLLTLKNEEYHNVFEREYGVSIKDFGPLRFPDIELNSKNRFKYLLRRIWRRGLHLFLEYPDIELMYRVKRALEKESGYDLLISIAVPHPIHWGVAWARNEEKPIARIWAADCGDPYMGAKLDSFNKLFYFQVFEKWFCRNADVITVPIEDAREGYYDKFHDKIKVIPQGFKFDEITTFPHRGSDNAVPTFGYAGSLIPNGRDPREFLEYLVSQKKDFKFILYTKTTALIEPFLERSDDRIIIKDYVPRKKLLEQLSKMDFLVNFENSSKLMMPSKLIDYYLTGRPVLSVSSSGINKDVIDQFLNGDYTNKYKFNGMDRYRIENVCNDFLELAS